MTQETQQTIQSLQKILEPTRIKIITMLNKRDTCACEMVKALKIKHNLLSHHLSTLVETGILNNMQNGRHSIYSIKQNKKECVKLILQLINKCKEK